MYMAYAYLARQNSALPINMCAADNRVNSACPTSRQLCLIVEGTVVNLARQEALVSELITSGQAYCNRQYVPLLLERPHGVLTLVSLLYSRVFLAVSSLSLKLPGGQYGTLHVHLCWRQSSKGQDYNSQMKQSSLSMRILIMVTPYSTYTCAVINQD